PHRAETGYGYLELEPGVEAAGVRRLRRFVEKPTLEAATRYVASGDYLWNAGIFVFRGATFLEILPRLQPEAAAGLEELAAAPGRRRELYARLPSDSIDYAVMEKLDAISTLPLDCRCGALGSWEALDEVLPHDAQGNAGRGDTLAVEARDNLLV